VEGTPAPGGISVSSPSDRFERAAETTADQVISTGRAADGPGQAAPAIQRQDALEDEDQVQQLTIQRREEAEDEPEDVPRPEEGPAQVQRPDEAAGAGAEGPAQAGASEVQRPEEEQDEVQQLAIQRRASRRTGGEAGAGQR
jgi:hypothetical protein